MKTPSQPMYPPHGYMALRTEGDVLVVDLHGPWNRECILEARKRAESLMVEMHRAGPWAIVVVIHGLMMGTPEALDEMRDAVVQEAAHAPVCVAWVPDIAAEGNDVAKPFVEEIYSGVVPLQFFETFAEAKKWVQMALRPGNEPPRAKRVA